jgi:hypothetical protein
MQERVRDLEAVRGIPRWWPQSFYGCEVAFSLAEVRRAVPVLVPRKTMKAPFRFPHSGLSGRTFSARRAALGLLPALALVMAPASAQTTVTTPAAPGGTVAALPGNPVRSGTPVIVVAAVDTSGNADIAKRALGLANSALRSTAGYSPAGASEYAPLSEALSKGALKGLNTTYPFTSSDYQKIGKAAKVKRAMTIQVSPLGEGYTAVAELYDTKIGALVGYGRGAGNGENGLETAVNAAVVALGDTATLRGIVISKPSGYVARLSLGLTSGARGGARVEYLGADGQPFAFGTLFDIAAGESLATIAPETAYPDVFVNSTVRLVNLPSARRALPTAGENDDKEFARFEKSFGVAAAVAGAVYYFGIRNN